MYILVDSRAIEIFINWSFVEKHDMSTWKLSQSIPVYNINGIPNKTGQISEVVDIVLFYKIHYTQSRVHLLFSVWTSKTWFSVSFSFRLITQELTGKKKRFL